MMDTRVEKERKQSRRSTLVQYADASKNGGGLLSRMVSSLQEESANFKSSISSGETNQLFLKQKNGVLVGREKQLILLHEVYQRVSKSQSEVVLVHGLSGMGKSTLLEAFVRQLPASVFYVNGKFDQLKSHAPYAALATASDQLCRQASRRKNSSAIRDRLREIMGSEINLLESVIPAIVKMTAGGTESPTDDGPTTNTPSTTAAGRGSTRFTLLFRAFLRCVASPENPVILFLDDIQWIDDASIAVVKSLVTDGLSRHIMIVGAYRDQDSISDLLRQCHLTDEICDNSNDGSRNSTMSSASSHRAYVTDIKVSALDVNALNELITSVLDMDESETLSLSHLVLKKTQGNAFHVLNFLDMLVSRSLLAKGEDGSWMWDEQQILERTNVSDNLAAILKAKLGDLPERVRSILEIASFIGHTFTTEILATIVHEEQDMIETEYSFNRHSRDVIYTRIVTTLKVAVAEGLLENTTEDDEYKFSHDKIQQCLYSDLIPDDVERKLLHQRIGAHIWNSVKDNKTSDFDDWVFLAAENLNRALSLVDYSGTRNKLIEVNLRAAKLAMTRSAFLVASRYLRIAVGLVDGDASWDTQYELCIDLYSTAAEAEKNATFFKRSRELAKEIHKRAKCFQHQHAAYSIEMQSLAVQGNLEESILLGLSVLRKIGVHFPKKTTIATIVRELLLAKIAIGRRSFEDLLLLPEMTDQNMLLALSLMNMVAMNSFTRGDSYSFGFIAVSLRMVRMTVRYGLSALYSPAAFAIWGGVHATLGRFEVSKGSEELSLAIIDKFNAESVRGRTMILNYSLSNLWKNALNHHVLHEFLRAHHLSMSFGDISFGYYGYVGWMLGGFYLDVPLSEMLNRLRSVVAEGRECEASTLLMLVQPILQVLLNLSGDLENEDPRLLTGEVIDKDYAMDLEEIVNARAGICVWRRCEHMVAHTYEDWDHVTELLPVNRQFERESAGYFAAGFTLGWDAISHCELYLANGKRTHKKEFRRIHKKIHTWAETGTVMLSGLDNWLAALESLCFKKASVLEIEKLFQEAFMSLAGNKNAYFEALATERLARMYLSEDMLSVKGRMYLTQAVELYKCWGALAKAEWLEQRYV